MVVLYKDPHGEKVFASVTRPSSHYSQTNGRENEVDTLRRRVRELEATLTISQVKVQSSY